MLEHLEAVSDLHRYDRRAFLKLRRALRERLRKLATKRNRTVKSFR